MRGILFIASSILHFIHLIIWLSLSEFHFIYINIFHYICINYIYSMHVFHGRMIIQKEILITPPSAGTLVSYAYVLNEKVTLFYDAENMLKKDDYLFSEENGITTITLNAACQSESFIMA